MKTPVTPASTWMATLGRVKDAAEELDTSMVNALGSCCFAYARRKKACAIGHPNNWVGSFAIAIAFQHEQVVCELDEELGLTQFDIGKWTDGGRLLPLDDGKKLT
jgi:hypothetical protein